MAMGKEIKALRLSREIVRELTESESKLVAGGKLTLVTQCRCTGYYPSYNAPCTTTAVSQNIC
jgi:hypothetical protein